MSVSDDWNIQTDVTNRVDTRRSVQAWLPITSSRAAKAVRQELWLHETLELWRHFKRQVPVESRELLNFHVGVLNKPKWQLNFC